MVQLVHSIDHYLYEKKRDIFILQIVDQSSGMMWYDRKDPANLAIEKEQLDWLIARNIDYKHTVPPGVLVGWTGLYYVDFSGWDDPVLTEYSKEFETPDGHSKEPSKYRMCFYSYQEWVDSGKLAEYEQFLIDIQDPNYEY